MATVYKIKIKQQDAGKRVPFPLVYLFAADNLPEMRRAFDSFIGFPARHQVNIPWGDVTVERRVDGVTREDATSCEAKLSEVIPDLYREENPWHFSVPILNRNVPPLNSSKAYRLAKKVKKNHPDARELYMGQVPYEETENSDTRPVLAYLSDPRWNNETQPVRAYPTTAYFATKKKVHAPVCGSCPRLPFHVAGECSIGDRVCFEAFREFFAPNMFSKLREYDLFLETLPDKPVPRDRPSPEQ